MCFPGAPLALGVAQGVVSFMGQQQNYEAEKARYEANYKQALEDNRLTEERLNAREMQENASYVQKDQLALIEGAEKQAQIRVAAAAGGVAGNGVQSIINEVGTQIGMKRAALSTQWLNSLDQTEAEKATGVAQEKARIGEVAPPVSPSPLGTILGVAGEGLKYASTSSGKSFFSSFGSSGVGDQPSSAGINVIPSGAGFAVSP